jgi:hypothetical protein
MRKPFVNLAGVSNSRNLMTLFSFLHSAIFFPISYFILRKSYFRAMRFLSYSTIISDLRLTNGATTSNLNHFLTAPWFEEDRERA